MVAFVSVQRAGVAIDVNGFPDSTVKPGGILVENFDIVPVDGVLSMLSVLYYRGRGDAQLSLALYS